MDNEEFCLDVINNLPNNFKAVQRFATVRRPGDRRYYQCDFHPYPCECEEYYYPTDDDECEDNHESEPAWNVDEAHKTEELEAAAQTVKQKERAISDVAPGNDEDKDDGDTKGAEPSASPAKTIHCYMTLVKGMRGVTETSAPGLSLAEPNACKGYSEVPGSVLWIENPDAYIYDYKQIFSRCCDGSVTNVVVEDSYIAIDEQQSKNFRDFCTMLAENCPALETIELWTPNDPRQQLEFFFKELRDNHKISITYRKHKQHPRRYRFSNGWTVLADRGLGIYGGSSNDNDSSNPTYFVYCQPGTPLAQSAPRRKDEDVCSTSNVAKRRYTSGGASMSQNTAKISVKNAFQCTMWEDKWHMKALDEGTSTCQFYHPTEYCDEYPKCPLGAMKCRKAHHFCSRANQRQYCSCPPDERDSQLNHRHAPNNVKR